MLMFDMFPLVSHMVSHSVPPSRVPTYLVLFLCQWCLSICPTTASYIIQDFIWEDSVDVTLIVGQNIHHLVHDLFVRVSGHTPFFFFDYRDFSSSCKY